MSVYATLGTHTIELLSGPVSFENKSAAVFAEHSLIGRKSAMQHTGFTPDDISFSIRLHSLWCNPAEQMQALKDIADAAKPVAFVFATGEYRGTFVILEITQTTVQTDGQGALIGLEASLTLKEYIGDPVKPNPPGVLSVGVRIDALNNPVVAIPKSPQGLFEMVGTALEVAGKVGEAVNRVQDIVAAASNGDILGAVGLAGAYAPQLTEMAAMLPVEEFQNLEGFTQIAAEAGAVANGLSQVQGFVNQASSQLQSANGLSGLSSAASSLQSAMGAANDTGPALARLDAYAQVGSRLMGLLE